jgi:MtN3 and saliva related transmembrane protein
VPISMGLSTGLPPPCRNLAQQLIRRHVGLVPAVGRYDPAIGGRCVVDERQHRCEIGRHTLSDLHNFVGHFSFRPATGFTMTRYVGYLAGLLTVVSLFPKVLRAWRTRQTKDLSVRTFVILIVASALWLTYGVLSSDWPVIATNGGMLVLNSAILTAKWRYK